jgi:spore coat protein U-like protein
LHDVIGNGQSTGIRKSLFCLAIAAALDAAGGYAWAGTCRVTATPVDFGLYPAIARGAITTVGSVTYTCVGPLAGGIKILMGPGESGSVTRRSMAGGDGRLPYVLSLDPQGSIPWGDGTRGTRFFFDPHPPQGRSVTIRVYGHIPPDQAVPPSLGYRDSVSVLVYY